MSALCISATSTIGDAIACIDRSGRVSIALIVDDERRLLNTVSDGDVRRGLLAGLAMTAPVTKLLAIKATSSRPLPVTAPPGLDAEVMLDLMRARGVRQIPIVAPEGRVLDVITLGDLFSEEPRALQAVVMAGGFGTRLRPLTEDVPKPMLPVGGRPLMELIIDQLRDTGVRKINITTHYQAEKILDHFGDGSSFGVDISYVNEESPLGTGGALGLMQPPEDTLLVINGDILTDIDFRAMQAYHQEHRASMTVAVRHYEVQVPYGVIDCDGPHVSGVREKPQLGFFVNAGIYLLEPDVYRHIPANQHLHMTDLIETLIREKQTVVSYPVREYWLDIGQHADYELAQADAKNGKWRSTGTKE
ncbi:MAG TPA: nucleotidyltransferase family protein [Candidatus Acidoferrales bacterium]|nr:nucleotidyltransferase family protein [Candidatus Acidoferrales bacterium]